MILSPSQIEVLPDIDIQIRHLSNPESFVFTVLSNKVGQQEAVFVENGDQLSAFAEMLGKVNNRILLLASGSNEPNSPIKPEDS